MKLCEHLRKIYQKEIENGNTISGIGANFATGWKMAVFFTKPHMELDDLNGLEISQFISPHSPRDERIICNQCKMNLSFPIEKDQREWYFPYSSTPNERVIATPKTVCVDETVSDWCIAPLYKDEAEGEII